MKGLFFHVIAKRYERAGSTAASRAHPADQRRESPTEGSKEGGACKSGHWWIRRRSASPFRVCPTGQKRQKRLTGVGHFYFGDDGKGWSRITAALTQRGDNNPDTGGRYKPSPISSE